MHEEVFCVTLGHGWRWIVPGIYLVGVGFDLVIYVGYHPSIKAQLAVPAVLPINGVFCKSHLLVTTPQRSLRHAGSWMTLDCTRH